MTRTLPPRPTAEQRHEVEELVCDLPGGRPGELAFDAPWQIRAFALAIGAHKAGQYDWAQFQRALVASIKDWEAEVEDVSDSSWSYYEHWVDALERVLDGQGTVASDALAARTQEILATPANRNHHEPHLEPVAIAPAIRH